MKIKKQIYKQILELEKIYEKEIKSMRLRYPTEIKWIEIEMDYEGMMFSLKWVLE